MNKKGFTLIELLAVIIILGVLMIIAVPSVTKYIEESRRSGYVSTAKEIAVGARNLIHSGTLDLDDFDTTYYIDANCIATDNGYKSPYGDLVNAYVVVAATNDNYEYFWTSVDDSGRGVKELINISNIDSDDIVTDIGSQEITTNRGIDGRSKIVIIDSNCQKSEPIERTGPKINSTTGVEIVDVCKRATSLHSTTCRSTHTTREGGCGATIGNGNTIIYGTIPNGAPKSGDAYDCDVNNDGVYDSATERFYYIMQEGNNSILIYSNNVANQINSSYGEGEDFSHGPTVAYQYLPSVDEWKNPNLILPGTRQIVAENEGMSAQFDPSSLFTYVGKAARLLTLHEEQIACGSTAVRVAGDLDRCNWLMENLAAYEVYSGNVVGYWFETPSALYSSAVWGIISSVRATYTISSSNTNNIGIRPVITIPTAYLE